MRTNYTELNNKIYYEAAGSLRFDFKRCQNELENGNKSFLFAQIKR